MLDQLLARAGDRLSEDTVRDLLGIAGADTVEAFVTALVDGDVATGIAVLEGLEDRGRDLRAFLDQVVEVVRGGLAGAPSQPPQGAPVAHGVTELVRVARRIGAIDPNRAGIGGLRLQLELALFPVDDRASSRSAPSSVGEPRLADSAPASMAPAQSVEPTRPATPATPAAKPTSKESRPRAHSRDDDRRAGQSAEAMATAPRPENGRGAPADEAAAAVAPVAASPAPATPSVEGGTAGGSDLEVLRSRWPEVVARVSAHPPTKPLIVVCRPIAVEDGVVTLGFPEDQGFLRDVAERRRSVLEDGIGAVLGRTVGVRCVATNLDLVPDIPADAEAAFVLAEARRIFGSDEPDAAEVT
jgi:hypothetical protein